MLCCAATIIADALLVWGWRVPFLLSIVTLAVATVLRYNMPESAEFSESAAAMDAAVMHRAVARRGRRVSKADNEDQAARVEPDAQMCIEDTETGGTNMVAGSGGEFSKRVHYVPVVELFRGYWLGLLLHSLYGSCEELCTMRHAPAGGCTRHATSRDCMYHLTSANSRPMHIACHRAQRVIPNRLQLAAQLPCDGRWSAPPHDALDGTVLHGALHGHGAHIWMGSRPWRSTPCYHNCNLTCIGSSSCTHVYGLPRWQPGIELGSAGSTPGNGWLRNGHAACNRVSHLPSRRANQWMQPWREH
jgi:hypothetical protein